MPVPETKRDRLRRLGVLNPRPHAVQAPWFQPAGFFDSNDLVQVKYEMLRHARQAGVTKAAAAVLFGLSRPTFYAAAAAFEREGLAGLIPRPCGRRSPHKVTTAVMALIEQRQQQGGPLGARTLAQQVQAQLGVSPYFGDRDRRVRNRDRDRSAGGVARLAV